MDIDWSKLRGGYGVPFDPRPAANILRQHPLDQEAWREFWDGLHHQGDLGEASYAAVPLLVDVFADRPRNWNLYGLVFIIEVERNRLSNPDIPVELTSIYFDALKRLKTFALEDLSETSDPLLVRTATALVALVSGELKLGALLTHIDTSELSHWLNEQLSWDEEYRSSSTFPQTQG
ncbi:MAG: hypothetical protein GY789_27560 [Hyphomicrobiales bacterium]|nr:hypothetical protein [Hyphomicrobiales bacterium]